MADDTNSKVMHLTNDTFDSTLEEAGDKPVFVDFYADWCGPCRMAAPVIDEMAEEHEDDAVIAKVDVDSEKELAQRYSVMSIPTVVLIQNGEELDRMTGFAGKQGYEDLLAKAE